MAVGGEPDPGQSPVVMVDPPLGQPGFLGPADQLGGAVRFHVQVVGQVADGGIVVAGVALDGQQQLVLGRGQAEAACGGLGEVQEAA